jgi:Flp pilus assembly secretin CpaC
MSRKSVVAFVLAVSAAVLSAASASAAPAASDDRALRLRAHDARLVALDDASRVTLIGDAAVADALLVEPGTLLVSARRAGVTRLRVMTAGGEVVLERDVIVTSAAAPRRAALEP